MRKNFFKKLSFVMALAMIVSVIAPAAGVFAATSLKLNKAEKTLHLSGEPGSNKYNFNIVGKEKGWKYSWTSSNEDVAEVNAKNGVAVATGIGKANITVVITDKKGAEVATLTAKVTVKDNIKTVAIANAPEKALAVGEEHDFNRSFVTLSGSTSKTTAITRWSIKEDTNNATINESNGVFKASVAGKYTVEARSFQSNAKYEEWKKTKADNLLLAEASVEVTVKAGVEKVYQVDLNKFAVEFDSNMKDSGLTKDTAKLYKVINGRDVETGTEKIKNLSFDESGKKATVEMYVSFSQEANYRFAYEDFTGTFTAAKVDLSLVDSIEFSDITANYNGTANYLVNYVVGKNKDGVIIYRGDNGSTDTAVQGFNNCLAFDYDSQDADRSKIVLDGKVAYGYVDGYSTPLKATFTYYYYNETTKAVETIIRTDSAIITAKRLSDVLNTSSLQFAVQTDASYWNWSWDGSKWNGPYTIAADDKGYMIFAKYKFNDKAAWQDPDIDANGSVLRYESTNTDKLVIQGHYIYPVAEGEVTVLAYYGDKVVGSFDIVIKPKRTLASATPDAGHVSASNHLTFGTNWTVTKITTKDTLGDGVDPSQLSVLEVKKIVGPNDELVVTAEPSFNSWERGKVNVNVDARGRLMGTYSYKIVLFYNNTVKEVVITISVIEANTADTKDLDDVTSWSLEINKADFDLKDLNNPQALEISVAGKNKNGQKIYQLPVSNYAVTITKNGAKQGRISANTADPVREKYVFDFVKVVSGISGDELSPVDVGTYVVTATVQAVPGNPINRVSGSAIGAATFTLKDTTRYEVKRDNTVVNAGTVLQMVKDAYTFNLNYGDVPDADITYVKYTNGKGEVLESKLNAEGTVISAGDSVIINEVHVKKANAAHNTIYKFTVNQTLKAK